MSGHQQGPRGTVDREREETGPKMPRAPARLQTWILGNGAGRGGQETGEGKKASARTARLRRPERGAGTQKSMQEGAEEGGGEAPQEQLGLRGARTPAPLGLVALQAVGCGRAPGSRLLHAASLAQRRPPPAAGSSTPSLPWGGVSYKGSCGCLERGARGRVSSESSPGARPAQGTVQRCCVTTWSSNLEGVGKAFLLMKSWKQWHISANIERIKILAS